ncbi:hypothetical protein BCV72DRAFT_335708 [Rhizopus microsporus var. microsporus]|uniref:Reverse transcriptase zinc-binding domain-containing protein n=2 Tax=Rhizopus microsporus TaxID=58291 RepID=A0A2G4T3V6_RHIZD|nr:uncharacterized protein RHIMIDRAFT_290024 [Rhizopus microsporus ATCC 52813]ORE06667.1 hypothetical protein BCV72DRAFT_335708 [Rhizopus microsporus var. microsporus]PHZ15679.1 hypothetical protein RHIMIDRAFT_290024 [Rhizopus microsporus ATCC 52813]
MAYSTSSEPLTYLQNPLLQSSRQRNSFQQCIVEKVSNACNIFKQGPLSIRDRATVLNVLIPSSLWHVLRVVGVNQKTSDTIRKIFRNFLGFRIFPSISLDTFQQLLKHGGLGFLEPNCQHLALQYRWLTPLLLNDDPSSFITLWLQAHLLGLSPLSIADARLPFLFPSFRKDPLAMNFPGVLSVLFRSFDALFDSGTVLTLLNSSLSERPKVSVEICLSLPLSEVINWPADGSLRVQRPYKSLQASPAFCLSPDHSHLIPKAWVNGRTTYFTSFFARLYLPGSIMAAVPSSLSEICGQLVHPWLEPNSDIILPRNFHKHHQQLLQQSGECQVSNMPRSMSFWRRFWNLLIPLQIRTPWYRLLQHKFPCASRMHKLLASSFSSECRFCQIPNVEDEMHFIL